MKLSLKLTLTLVASVAAILAAYGAVRVERELSLFRSDMSADHRAFGRALAAAASDVAHQEGAARALQLIEGANLREVGVDVRWVEPGGTSPESRIIESDETRFLVTDVPLRLGPEREGAIRLTESMEHEDEYVETTIERVVAATLTTIVVSGLIILGFGVLFVGRPLDQLMDKARRVGSGDLSGPLHLRQRDEIGALAGEMNAMCDRLAAAQETAERETAARLSTLEQLRHADRLATVGKLASGLAHELGTPLNVVQARARMIERGESEGELARRDAAIVAEQAARMTAIIRQLLDFARRRPPQMERHDLAELARRTVALLQSIARRKGVVLEGPHEAAAFDAEVDAPQLEQVLTNVVINAVQAQPNGGRVRMSVGRTRRPAPAPADPSERDWVCLTVEDEGVGIAPEVLPHVFEPFYTTKDVGEGTGLGLSVAWGIVQDHGGFIEVDSEPGHGARFTIHVPDPETP